MNAVYCTYAAYQTCMYGANVIEAEERSSSASLLTNE